MSGFDDTGSANSGPWDAADLPGGWKASAQVFLLGERRAGLGDLAATGRKVPAALVEQIKRLWPNENGDLDELLYSRLAQVTPGKHGSS